MPRLREDTRSQRRQAILVSAWGCFSRNGFHATTMDDVIAAHGASASAVYRYFASKDELIDATADEGLARVGAIFEDLLKAEPTPSPGQTLEVIVTELRGRAENPDYDFSRLAVQNWAEALRRPALAGRTRTLYLEVHARLADLAGQWKDNGQLADSADSAAVASVVFALMHGLIVCHHLAGEVEVEELTRGLVGLGDGLTLGTRVAETLAEIAP